MGYLAAAGPALIEEIKRELGFEAVALRAVRECLERVGALVSQSVTVAAQNGGERETSELARWDQRFLAAPDNLPGGLEELAVAGVYAAVVAPAREIQFWFSWPLPHGLLTRLIEQGRLWQPQAGWVTAREEQGLLQN